MITEMAATSHVCGLKAANSLYLPPPGPTTTEYHMRKWKLNFPYKSPDKQAVSMMSANPTFGFGFSKGKGGGGGGGGSGVLERPTFDQSQFDAFVRVLEGGDIGRLKDKKLIGSGDSYRVLLIDDVCHSEKLVSKVLPQVVPSITPDDAGKLFHESRENGMAVVIVTVKEHAEFYSQMMVRGGLRSTIEPDSSI